MPPTRLNNGQVIIHNAGLIFDTNCPGMSTAGKEDLPQTPCPGTKINHEASFDDPADPSNYMSDFKLEFELATASPKLATVWTFSQPVNKENVIITGAVRLEEKYIFTFIT